MFIPLIIFVIAFVGIIVTFISIGSKNNESDFPGVDNIFDNNENKEINVNMNEFAETKKYKVKVEKYQVEEDIFNRLEPGYEYVKFYLIVENLTAGEITKEDVYCIVDGVSQTNDFTSGYSDLPMFIAKDLTVTGTATFEVPKSTTSFDIRYGDYVTIHIEK